MASNGAPRDAGLFRRLKGAGFRRVKCEKRFPKRRSRGSRRWRSARLRWPPSLHRPPSTFTAAAAGGTAAGAAVGTAAAGTAVAGMAAATGIPAIGAAACGTMDGGARRSPPASCSARAAATLWYGYGYGGVLAEPPGIFHGRRLSRLPDGQRLPVRRAAVKKKRAARSGALSFEARARRRRRSSAFGTPVVVGKDSGAPRRERKRQIGETLRLEGVAVEADRLDRFDRDAEPRCEPAHQRRIPPTARR